MDKIGNGKCTYNSKLSMYLRIYSECLVVTVNPHAAEAC
jgi:hypothetical protein